MVCLPLRCVKQLKIMTLPHLKRVCLKAMGNDVLLAIFTELQDAMGVTPKEAAVAEDWQVAPRLILADLERNT